MWSMSRLCLGSLIGVLWLCTGCPEAPSAGQARTPIGTSEGVGLVNAEKLDKALLEEIAARRESRSAPGELLDQRFEVEIELAQSIAMPKDLPRQQALQELARLVERSQADVVAKLQALGVDDFERLLLANSLATTLTLEQIGEISRHEDVRLIRLRRLRKVTTAA